MSPYLILAFAAGGFLGALIVALVAGGKADDAYRAGLADGREALQRETLERVWADLDLDSYGGTDTEDTPTIHTEDYRE